MNLSDKSLFKNSPIAGRVALVVTLVLTVVAPQLVYTQTFSVIHNFVGGQDGEHPYTSVVMDPAGSLYGTTTGGTSFGSVFKLEHKHGGWVLTPLRTFQGGSDGAYPLAGVIFGPSGELYGTTEDGGSGAGTVFALDPTCATPRCILYRFRRFSGSGDGMGPNYGELISDPAGNLYGVTIVGGFARQGTVYELTQSGGGWQEKVLYTFSGLADGAQPFGGLILNTVGNFYGTAQLGGSNGFGTVYQLTPTESGWEEKTLYAFQGLSDGAAPVSSLILDQSGNLYGSTCAGGDGGGTVFELASSNGKWMFNTLHSFTDRDCPWASLTMDAVGNLYGTTVNGGNKQGVCYPGGCGTVYKLSLSSRGWAYTAIHNFTGFDGQNPYSHLISDASGNFYGTTANGGTGGNCDGGCGVIFRIKP